MGSFDNFLLAFTFLIGPFCVFSSTEFGGETLETFACPFAWNDSSCDDPISFQEKYQAKCFGPLTCRGLYSSGSCPICTGNTLVRDDVYVRDYYETSASDPWRWRASFPANCNNCPVMIWATTGISKVDLEQYEQIVEQAVSFGMVVVSFSSTELFSSFFFPTLAEAMTPIINYITEGGLAEDMQSVGSTPRTDKLIYGGHGQGARLVLQRLSDFSCQGTIFGGVSCPCEKGLVGGVLMISPVEDLSTSVDVGNGVIVKENVQVPFNVPALMIYGGEDAKQGTSGVASCAPPEISNDHFYNNWEGPIWAIQYEEFGHNDMTTFDDDGAFCGTTEIGSDFDLPPSLQPVIPLTREQKINLYRRGVSGMMFSFVDGLLNGNSASFEGIQTDLPDNFALSVFGPQDLRIFVKRRNVPEDALTAGVTPQCTYTPKLFSDEVQILLYVTYAVAGAIIVFGLPSLFYFKIYKPMKSYEKNLPDAIKEELAAENLIKTKAKNPTFSSPIEPVLTPQATPPPGMDDGLSGISSIVQDGEESVVPYRVNDPESVRMSGQTNNDDIF